MKYINFFQKADEALKDSPPIENKLLEDDLYVDNSSSTDDEQESLDKSPDRQDAATETNHYVAQDDSLYRRGEHNVVMLNFFVANVLI